MTVEQCEAEIEKIFDRIRARQDTGCAEQPDTPESLALAERIHEVYAAVAERDAKPRQLAAYAAEQERIEKLYADALAADEAAHQAAETETQKLERLWRASPERLAK